MDFRPVHFIPHSEKDNILAYQIDALLAVAHEAAAATNHLCLSLRVSESLSITIDCLPSHTTPGTILTDGSKAHVIISDSQAVNPNDVPWVFLHAVRPGTTVGDVYNCVIENGRHKYEFDSAGVGCRYWISDLLSLLLAERLLVDEGEVAKTKAALVKLWPEQTPLPLTKGAYYE